MNFIGLVFFILIGHEDVFSTILLPCPDPYLFESCNMTCCTDFTTGVVIFSHNGEHKYLCINNNCRETEDYEGYREGTNVTIHIKSINNDTAGKWKCLAEGTFSNEIWIKPNTMKKYQMTHHERNYTTDMETDDLSDLPDLLHKHRGNEWRYMIIGIFVGLVIGLIIGVGISKFYRAKVKKQVKTDDPSEDEQQSFSNINKLL